MAEWPRATNPKTLSAEAALFPLRLFLGGTFVYAGMQKLADPGYLTPGASTYIGTQLQQFAHGTPGGFILRALAIPHAELAGVLAALLELVIGLLVLGGWMTRLAALGGLSVNLLLFLTNSWNTHPYFLGSDIVFVFAWLPVVLAGAAGQPAVDTWLARERKGLGRTTVANRRAGRSGEEGLTRRAALGSGLVAAGAAVLAGVSLVIKSGRGQAVVTRSAQLGGGGGRAAATTGSATTSTGTTASSGVPAGAVRLGPLSRLAPGQAAVYRDPGDGSADIAIRARDGSLTALSAICPHAGCAVSYEGATGQLVCPCHGSLFDATSGAVIQGPAVTPLAQRQVVVHDGILYAVRAKA